MNYTFENGDRPLPIFTSVMYKNIEHFIDEIDFENGSYYIRESNNAHRAQWINYRMVETLENWKKFNSPPPIIEVSNKPKQTECDCGAYYTFGRTIKETHSTWCKFVTGRKW